MATDQQLYLAVGAPMLFNAVLVGLLIADVEEVLDSRPKHLEER